MDEQAKRKLLELIERGDVYGLMLASVNVYLGAYHPESLWAALYAFWPDAELPPSRVVIPRPSASSSVAPPPPQAEPPAL